VEAPALVPATMIFAVTPFHRTVASFVRLTTARAICARAVVNTGRVVFHCLTVRVGVLGFGRRTQHDSRDEKYGDQNNENQFKPFHANSFQ